MKKITVLGAGMVGSAIAIDLAKSYDVTAVDLKNDSLEKLTKNLKIETVCTDVTKEDELAKVIKDSDLVLSAVPGFLGFQTMVNVIKSGKDLVDISFLAEDVLELDSLAKENNVTVIMDCGVAPGMSNIILGYHNEHMNIEKIDYYVGGLPKERTFPFEYKAPFSPCDVIEEYTRPARYVENGNIITKPAMSDVELLDFENVGTLEAFNSDGLRSLIYTMKNIPDMKEKTLRYPGHINTIQKFFAAGFLDKKSINVKGIEISPFDFTTELLYKAWKLNPGEKEFTILKIIISGVENGTRKQIVYDLYDEYDEVEDISSMARTTGFTATAAAEMILNNKFNLKGMFPPELIGKYPGCYEYLLQHLSERNIVLNKNVKML